jgi:hypothetical protein
MMRDHKVYSHVFVFFLLQLCQNVFCLFRHEEALKLNVNQAHVFVAALNVSVCLFVST